MRSDEHGTKDGGKKCRDDSLCTDIHYTRVGLECGPVVCDGCGIRRNRGYGGGSPEPTHSRVLPRPPSGPTDGYPVPTGQTRTLLLPRLLRPQNGVLTATPHPPGPHVSSESYRTPSVGRYTVNSKDYCKSSLSRPVFSGPESQFQARGDRGWVLSSPFGSPSQTWRNSSPDPGPHSRLDVEW